MNGFQHFIEIKANWDKCIDFVLFPYNDKKIGKTAILWYSHEAKIKLIIVTLILGKPSSSLLSTVSNLPIKLFSISIVIITSLNYYC